MWGFTDILAFLSAKKSLGENECPLPKILVSMTMSQFSDCQSGSDGCDYCPGDGGGDKDPKPLPFLLLTYEPRHSPTLLRLEIPVLTLGIFMTFSGGCGRSSEWLCVECLQAWLGPGEHSCLEDGEEIRWGNYILLGRMGQVMPSV